MHIDIQHKQGAINVDFSDGSWLYAAFPEVLNWDKVNRNFFCGDLSIQVIEAKPGMESENKNVDYKIEFQVNGEKVVLHAYNGKQRFTVSGKNHVNFVTKYIQPFFTKNIECYVSEADKFNETVITNIGRTVKREKVKFKTSQSQSQTSVLVESSRARQAGSLKQPILFIILWGQSIMATQFLANMGLSCIIFSIDDETYFEFSSKIYENLGNI